MTPRRSMSNLVILSSLTMSITSAGAQTALSKALTEPTVVEFNETPISEVAARLAQQHDVNIILDKKQMSAAGISKDAPITGSLSRTTLGSALRLLLAQHEMTYIVNDEVVVLTTIEAHDEHITTAVYPVADLLKTGTFEEVVSPVMVEVVVQAAEPESWDEVGGRCVIDIADTTLFVGQTTHGHEGIAHLLRSLRQAEKFTDQPQTRRDPVRAALDRQVAFDFEKASLPDVAAFLEQHLDVDVVISPDVPPKLRLNTFGVITGKSGDLLLRDALDRLLRPLDLTAVPHEGVLWITTAEQVPFDVRVYDVRTLVEPAPDEPTAPLSMADLYDLMLLLVDPDSWDENGGLATLGVVRHFLVVRHNENSHRKIESLLQILRGVGLRTESKRGAGGDLSAALDKRIDCNFSKLPLKDAVGRLAKVMQVDVRLNPRRMADVGASGATTVSLKLEGVKAEAVLDLLLSPLGLSWTINAGSIEVTSKEDAQRRMILRAYDLKPILNDNLSNDQLREVVITTIDPNSWDDLGGLAAAYVVRNTMVVLQTPQNHRRISELLQPLAKGNNQVSVKRTP